MTETHPQNRLIGYARVSTYGQTLDAQLEQLRGAGCTKIFREKVTGAHSDRRQLLKMLDTLAPGDVVTVTRIDRLARSTFDLFAIVIEPRAANRSKNRFTKNGARVRVDCQSSEPAFVKLQKPRHGDAIGGARVRVADMRGEEIDEAERCALAAGNG